MRKTRNYWTKDKCHQEALKYETKRNFKEYSGSAYYHANKNQWIDDICSHMILKNKPRNYWDKIKCREEALKYTNRNNFCLFSSGAYRSAKKHGWFNEITKHIKSKITKWTVDDVRTEALKYNGRYEFNKNNLAAYTWALRHGILNEICSHMPLNK
jgi:hypothetical protein